MPEADVEEGVREGFTLAEQAEPLERPKRNRLSKRENYILRRAAVYLDQTILPKSPRDARQHLQERQRHNGLADIKRQVTDENLAADSSVVAVCVIGSPPGKSSK